MGKAKLALYYHPIWLIIIVFNPCQHCERAVFSKQLYGHFHRQNGPLPLSSKESFCGALLSHFGTLAALTPLSKAPPSIFKVYVVIAGPEWPPNMEP